jgi:hypothetical protein
MAGPRHISTALSLILALPTGARAESARSLQSAFPRLEVTRSTIDIDQIQSGGVPRDGIPAILDPEFLSANRIADLVS